MTFNHLGLSQKTLDAVEASGFTTPTPIQDQAIPPANEGRDVMGIAQTGTGKTASFVLPMLTRLESGRARARMPRSLILEPTRELAAQVTEAFDRLGINHKLNVALLIGGVSFDEQLRKLDRGADVLIATPGRLLDHFKRGKILLSGVETLVIDEADRMLDMGFIPDIEEICSKLPPNRQTLFFSATMPKEVKKLADKFLKDPVRVEVSPPSSAAQTITQKLKLAPADIKSKREILRELLNEADVKNAIIFCNRKRDVGILHRSLVKHGYNAGALHGDMEQRERTATLDAFRKGEILLLAASDVAARGLDIPDVSHIFNFDVPITPEDYVHRIGRTGRAGREGYAATLVTPGDIDAVRAIEKLCQRKIDWLDGEPSPEELVVERRSRGRRGRVGTSSSEGRVSSRSSEGRLSEGRSSSSEGRSSGGRSSSRSGESRSSEKPAERRRSAPSASAAGASAPRDRKSNRHASSNTDHASTDRAPKDQPVKAVKVVESSPSNGSAPERSAKNGSRGNRSRGREKEDATVVGMGDHVPAFLMNPIRRAR